jgi:hypothetical protein
MRTDGPSLHHLPMPERSDAPPKAASVRIYMDIELDAEPIRGTLGLTGAGTRPFNGWLGLSAALEAVRAGRGIDSMETPRGVAEKTPVRTEGRES